MTSIDWSSVLAYGLLFLAALGGGAMNAVAGGGTFLTFPSLTFSGLSLLSANATSTVALWPGTVSSAIALRQQWGTYRSRLAGYLLISLFGGLAGALLLLRLSSDTLGDVFPYLLLTATLLFAFKSRLEKQQTAERPSPAWLQTLVLLLVAIYGGFFGGGMGIMMMAMFSLLGMTDVRNANALKVLLTVVVNGISVVTFIVADVIVWPSALVMVGGSILGGYVGAVYARRVSPQRLRIIIVSIGLILTVYFFLR
ncbi:sulfite exporter TauE/SafE family protein [Fibrisoma montanum]|uniref:Probable membrane transporter protein n=1 Tax=Fibrisoma montanum TaxID=2305895 RepID=A0A418M5H4_9BACT|nr:sulfite exporter TauE/SafE family protein [Fibrisoma montanum]RIV21150.1 sulfite exporter TauE/SafE family protein [Fibrisoma montanum]